MPKEVIMVEILAIISKYPEYVALLFTATNALWIVFAFFYSRSHEKKLKKIQHELDLDVERRKKVFELKVGQYENYVNKLDEFGRGYQSELFEKMKNPIEEFFERMLSASSEQDKKQAQSEFALKTMALLNDCSSQYYLLKSESKSLKLTASDKLLEIFEELDGLVEHSISAARDSIEKLIILMSMDNNQEIIYLQNKISQEGILIRDKSKELEQQMRLDLSVI